MTTYTTNIPAGWYPDPLGLPQLRWWDNHTWTDQISGARAPLVHQLVDVDFADPAEAERDEESQPVTASAPSCANQHPNPPWPAPCGS